MTSMALYYTLCAEQHEAQAKAHAMQAALVRIDPYVSPGDRLRQEVEWMNHASANRKFARAYRAMAEREA